MSLAAAAAKAAQGLRQAKALLVTAGAGMGVDSGLPDFRGTQGLWREYPPLANLQLDFADMANPDWFSEDPCFAWGFYGHRLLLYRRTVPHSGFEVLRRWGSRMSGGHFVFTSNVDGQFQRAGFAEDRICECHGSIHFLQSLRGGPIRPADGLALPEVDPAVLRLPEEALPRTPEGSLARPNILMFGDWGWDGSRTDAQRQRFSEWFGGLGQAAPATTGGGGEAVSGEEGGGAAGRGGIVVVELGAGEAVPTVRRTSESLAAQTGGLLVRINPRESHIPMRSGLRGVSLPCGAAEGLGLIDAELQALN